MQFLKTWLSGTDAPYFVGQKNPFPGRKRALRVFSCLHTRRTAAAKFYKWTFNKYTQIGQQPVEIKMSWIGTGCCPVESRWWSVIKTGVDWQLFHQNLCATISWSIYQAVIDCLVWFGYSFYLITYKLHCQSVAVRTIRWLIDDCVYVVDQFNLIRWAIIIMYGKLLSF